jgi:arginine deiminase
MKMTAIPPLPAPAFQMDFKATMRKRLALGTMKRHKK